MTPKTAAAAALGVVLALSVARLPSAAAGVDASRVPTPDSVVVVVFENKELPEVIGSGEAPTFAALAGRYALLTDYHGVAHPSLPNYLALVSGSTQGVTSDCTSCVVAARNLADTLERAGKTWKTYAEGLPTPGFTGASAGRYAKKHDPLLYFEDVAARPGRLRRIVPLSAFWRDFRAHALPDFSLVVPDLCHDMHDCSVATGDAWLRGFVRPLLRSHELGRGVVYVVFDEGTSDAGGGGRVPALVLGPLVRPGARDRKPLDHYSLLRTIEDGWRLPRLARSAAARPITGIWR
jgi:acid phosphatase